MDKFNPFKKLFSKSTPSKEEPKKIPDTESKKPLEEDENSFFDSPVEQIKPKEKSPLEIIVEKKLEIERHTKDNREDCVKLRRMIELIKSREFENEKEIMKFMFEPSQTDEEANECFMLCVNLRNRDNITPYFVSRNYEAIEKEIQKKEEVIKSYTRDLTLEGTELNKKIKSETIPIYNKRTEETRPLYYELSDLTTKINYIEKKKYHDMFYSPEKYDMDLKSVKTFLVDKNIFPSDYEEEKVYYRIIDAYKNAAENDLREVKDNSDMPNYLDGSNTEETLKTLTQKRDAIKNQINEINEKYDKEEKIILDKYESEIVALEKEFNSLSA